MPSTLTHVSIVGNFAATACRINRIIKSRDAFVGEGKERYYLLKGYRGFHTKEIDRPINQSKLEANTCS